MSRRKPWTVRRCDAALNAITAMLAGEEGAGDWDPANKAEDLEAARDILIDIRDRLSVKRPAALDVWCPRCGVLAGEPCQATHPQHGLLWRPSIKHPHRERAVEAREVSAGKVP